LHLGDYLSIRSVRCVRELASEAVAVVHGAIVVLAVLALPFMPCLLILIVRADDLLEASGRTWRRRRREVRERRDARRLLRAAGLCPARPWHRLRRRRQPESAAGTVEPGAAGKPAEPLPTGRPVGPPIERLAADLRRLAGQRLGLATRSPVWFSAVQRAYDDRLCVACEELEIEQHLAELSDVDLDIERVRVEGMLQAAGLSFRDAEADRT
jgi:hypothetical protein